MEPNIDPRLIIDVSEEAIAEIVAAGTIRTFQPDAYLFRADDEPDAVFQLISGRVKFWRTSRSGDALTLAYRTAGTFLGFPVIHERASHTVNATAETEVRALVWSGPALSLFFENPLIQRNALAVVTGQMHRLMSRLEDQRSVGVEARLARAICKIVSEIGERRPDGAMCMPITRQDLADYAAVTLYTASRVLSQWREAGVLQPSRGRILVNDLSAVSDFAQFAK